MARIAFNSTAGNTGGGGWSPFPNGDIDFQIDAVAQAVSRQNNAQLKISMHVIDGPYAGQKANVWYSLLAQAAFRLEALLNATLPEDAYERVETGEVQVRTVKGQEIEEPIYTFSFDTDDLVGAQLTFAVTQKEYNGKVSNDFNEPRAIAAAAPAPKAVAKPVAAPSHLPAKAAPAATVALPARRRVGG